MKEAKNENEKHVRQKTIIYSAVLAVVVFFSATGILIYAFGMNNRFTRAVTSVVPYPAAVVNGTRFIRVETLQENLVSTRQFYESQDFSELGLRVDFKTSDGEKRLKIKEKNLLNKLIENQIIRNLAEERGIKITQEMVKQEVDRKLNESGNRENVLSNLEKLYGWNLEDFEQRLVRPDIYKQKLVESVRESDLEMIEAENKAKTALEQLESGADFSEVAKKYSDGDSAKNGGDLGWIAMDQMIPEIAAAASRLEAGSRTGIIESALGFHIVMLDEKEAEAEVPRFKLRQVFVRSKNFADWFFEQEKNFSVYIPLRDYYWDKESQVVQFTDHDLAEFEKKLPENSPDDITVIF